MRGSGSNQDNSVPAPRRDPSDLSSWEEIEEHLDQTSSAIEEEETWSPEPLSEDTKATIQSAGDWIRLYIDGDIASIKAGVAFEDLSYLPAALPSIHARHYTPEFLEQFKQELKIAEECLTAYPEEKRLNSTAQELAAHALIQESKSLISSWQEEGLTGDNDPSFVKDPEKSEAQLDDLSEDAFEDHDVLMLFDARFDGLESSDVAEQLGMVNLGIDDWFEPFRD